MEKFKVLSQEEIDKMDCMVICHISRKGNYIIACSIYDTGRHRVIWSSGDIIYISLL